MKYKYDAKQECFIREDGKGKRFLINSTEAMRILTLQKLGYGVAKINRKIDFSSKKVSESTIQNFIKNVENGDIIIDDSLPAPRVDYDDLALSDRVQMLESKVEALEEMLLNYNCNCNRNVLDKTSFRDKVKSWIKF